MRRLGFAFICLAGLALGCPSPAGDGDVGSTSGSGSESESGSESDSGSTESADTETDESDTDTATDTSAELDAEAGPDQYAIVEEAVALDGSASTGAALYHWDFGDGTDSGEPSPDPTAEHVYATPGRYYPVLTVFDEMDGSLADNLTVSVTLEPTHQPRATSTVVTEIGGERVAVVSHDASELTVIERVAPGEDAQFEVVDQSPTCAGPRTLSAHEGGGLIACPEVDHVQRFTWDDGPGVGWDLPWGSRPTAALMVDDLVVVALAGRGALAIQSILDPSPNFSFIDGFPDARGLALWPDGRVAVSRWRSPDDRGEITLVDLDTLETELLPLAYDPTPASDTEIGGVPSYLDAILVSPTADHVAVPSLQANILHGEYLNGETLTFEFTIRAIVSFLDLEPADGQGLIAASEDFDRRKQFDNRGFASAGVHSSRGDYLFVAMRGSRAVERFDTLTSSIAGTLLDVGYAPHGLALSPDDRHLYVHAEFSRELRVYDVSNFDVLPQPIVALATVSAEPLDPEVYRGQQLFNDSFDPRLAKHGYIACAHCHLDGEADRRTWDFTDRGEGLRNTISLLGRGGIAHGPIHWSANFDEVQDFEHDIRGPFAGFGLLDDADWNTGTVSTTLGDPKLGLSEDLDALAAYVESLAEFPRSPYREADGGLTADALAGKALFESPTLGCQTCHGGEAMTDSTWLAPADPLLHDVGTITEGSGLRLGEPLTGLDTPTLRGQWNDPPFLHDGSAPTLRDVLTTANPGDLHGMTSQLSPAELDQLVAYLRSLDDQID